MNIKTKSEERITTLIKWSPLSWEQKSAEKERQLPEFCFKIFTLYVGKL